MLVYALEVSRLGCHFRNLDLAVGFKNNYQSRIASA